MNIEIKTVLTGKEKKEFIGFPYLLHKGNKQWIAPLRINQKELFSEQHPFWKVNKKQFFLAFINKKCVGRIAAFTNIDYESYFKTSTGFFGFLEAIDDVRVFIALLSKAEEFLKSLGYKTICGPLNPSIHFELGVLVKGFELPPYFMQTYNKSYYDQYITKYGFIKLKDFFSYKLVTKDFIQTEKMIRVQTFLQKKYEIKIRTPDLKNFNAEIKIFFELYNNAFVGHWGFSPISWEDFKFLAKDMKMILDKEMILIAEKNQVPIAFLLALPNLNEVLSKIKNGYLFPFGFLKLLLSKGNIKGVRVITVAIKREWEHLGIGSILYPEIAIRARRQGYENAELSWVVEDNIKMNKISKALGAEVYKCHRLYEKSNEY
ncbi:hypothetical protein [Aquiflexum sp.]|uniref:hypothetical protein n=1 Tax=Aquiflexum sp. TaxID=1872584 RepID=UPI003593EA3F